MNAPLPHRPLLLAAALALLLGAVPRGNAALVADYRFADSLDNALAAGSPLQHVGPGNTFATETVDGAPRRVLQFPAGGGVRLNNLSSLLSSTASYTVVMQFRFAAVDGYRKILDFKNGALDSGLYNYSSELVFYDPGHGGPASAIGAGDYVTVALTRNAGDSLVTAYVNGVPQFSFTDSSDRAVADANDRFIFFQDDAATGGSEVSAGAVARIQLYSTALSAAEIAQLDLRPNLALNKPLTPHTNVVLGNPSFANDGDWSTYWYSYQGSVTSNSFTIDLEAVYSIGRYIFQPLQVEYYRIETSTDGTSWETRHQELGLWGSPIVTQEVAEAYSARYVRFTCGNAQVAYAGIIEFEVYGLPSTIVAVTDSVEPADDHWVPFGEVPVGDARTERVTVRNNGESNLVVNLIGFGEEEGNEPQQPEAPSTTVPCYGIEMSGYNLVSFDANDPANLTVIGPTGSDLISAVEFIQGDLSRLIGIVYNANQLISISTADGTRTVIGPCVPQNGESWTGLAEDPTDGTLYACGSDGSNSTLYRINPATGEATVIGNVGSSILLIAIAINNEGDLYGVDILNDTLVSIDKATGAGTVVGPLGVDANYAQGMDFDADTDILYWASYSSGPELRTIDTATGASTLVGAFPGGSELNIAVARGSRFIPFRLEGLPELPATLAPGEEFTFDVVFAPKSAGPHQADLWIESDGQPAVSVLLTGVGIEGTPLPVTQGSVMERQPEDFLDGAPGRFDCAESSDTNVVVATLTPEGLLRLVAVGPGRATVTLCLYNADTDASSQTTLLIEVVGPPSVESSAFAPREPWNPRFTQLISLRNDSGLDAIGVRVLFSDLQPGIAVENQTGVSDDGRPMIEIELPFANGNGLDLSIVYLCTGAFLVDEYPPTLEFQYILPAWTPATGGSGVDVDVRLLMQDGRVVIEFDSVPGRTYAIEYMNDFPDGTWREIPLRLEAGANKTQWIDPGPPATEPPSGVRVYRVKDVTNEGGTV